MSTPVPTQISTIDCQYVFSEYAAAFLIRSGAEAAFIENNTHHSVPILMQALQKQNLNPEQVRYIIVTHIHLDHAGGTSSLLKACPQAKVVAHPRAVKHLKDPSKLTQSARKVYGDEAFDRLYGSISAIDSLKLIAPLDGDTLSLGKTTLRFFHTRGHANHHFCIQEPQTETVFTGDSFGVSYPALNRKLMKAPLIFPSTSPTDFDPELALASVQTIAGCGAQTAHLTHFGPFGNLPALAQDLNAHLEFGAELLEHCIQSSWQPQEMSAYCLEKLRAYFEKLLNERGLKPEAQDWELLKLDLTLNADGIAYTAQKRRERGSGEATPVSI